MLGDIMGSMESQQKQLKETLQDIRIEEGQEDPKLSVVLDGNRSVININVGAELMDLGRREELEDLLVVLVNKALERAQNIEQEESQKMIQNLMPPGMGDLSNLFGK